MVSFLIIARARSMSQRQPAGPVIRKATAEQPLAQSACAGRMGEDSDGGIGFYRCAGLSAKRLWDS